MQKLLKALLPFIIFSLIVVLLLTGLRHNPRGVPSPYIGKPVPAFTAALLEHPEQPVTEKIFPGQVTLLNIFASWCLYCRMEHPLLMDIVHSHRIKIIGLNYKDEIKDAKKMLSQYGNPYSMVISDPKGALAIRFGAYGTPETFLIDEKGIIRYRHVGPISPQNWRETLLPLINKIKENT